VFEALLQDIRFGARMLRKNIGFTSVAVITLALGIGANSAIFSLVNGILLRPLPYSQPERLVSMWEMGMPKGALLALQARAQTLEIAGYTRDAGFNLTGLSEPLRLKGSRVSTNLFSMLGVNAEAGRVFQAGEEAPTQSRVVVLSHALSQRLPGNDPETIGRWVTIEGTNYQVIGVMSTEFRFPSAETDFWIPMQVDPGGRSLWGDFSYIPLGRMRAGVKIDQVRAEYRALVPQVVKLFPWPMPAHYAEWTTATELQSAEVGSVRTKLLLLLGAVGLVLLIACANVANLLLLRAAARQKEITVRTALGAGRGVLVRQLLTESLLIAICGGALGLALARGGLTLLRNFLPADTPRLVETAVDFRVLWFTSALVLITGILFGLAPAWRASRTDIESVLRGSSQKSGTGRERRRLSAALVIAESALMVVLLVGAGLVLKSLWRLSHLEIGVPADHVVTALLTPNGAACSQGDRCVGFYTEVQQKIAALPGVESVAIADSVPFGDVGATALAVEDHPEFSAASPYSAWYFSASPNLLRTLGIPLLAGRDFLDSDRAGAPGVVLVSRKMAERLWPGQNPLGKHVKPSWMKDWRTVAGVVADVRESSVAQEGSERVVGDIYFPAAQGIIVPISDARIVVRTAARPEETETSLREVIAKIRSDVPVSQIRTMDEVLARSISAPRSTASLFALFAALALLLGAIGIYSVISYSVAERTQEIGVRVAIGAQRSDVLKMVLGEGLKLAGSGLVIGLVAALVASRLMQAILYEVQPVDASTYAGVAVILAGVAALACYVPARNAMRVDPMVALRHE
jgi:predicted permease